MPDFNPPSAGGPGGALAWYNRSLAKVLGLNPADPTLSADLLSDLSTSAQRKALGALLDRRFQRRVDATTGAVTMERMGDALILTEPNEDSDSVIGGLATTYLGAAGAAIAAIDPNQCIPGVCGEQLGGILRQIQANIATVIAEAPTRRNRFQMHLHMDELTSDDGLMARLGRIFGPADDVPPDSVGREKAINSIDLARKMLESFERAVESRSDGDLPSLAEIAEVVAGCGGHVSTHARNVRSALRAAGIGSCELHAVELRIAPMHTGCGPIDRITLDEGLQTLETEPNRWSVLIASGQSGGFDSVKRSAVRLKPMVEAIDPAWILKTLGVLAESDTQSGPREAFALNLSYQLDRLRGYTLSVLRMILREAPPEASSPADSHNV